MLDHSLTLDIEEEYHRQLELNRLEKSFKNIGNHITQLINQLNQKESEDNHVS